jgi:nitrate/nitrite transporter NarK
MGGAWQSIAMVYAIILAITAVLFFLFTKDDPALQERRQKGIKHVPFLKQMEPLKNLQVWRFSLYYFFVFGAFVALALWLPRYYVGAYGMELGVAGMLAACYALPGSIFRELGGWMSDKWGARAVMYWTFIACVICTFIMSYPETRYTVNAIGDSSVIKNVQMIDGERMVRKDTIVQIFADMDKQDAGAVLPATELVPVAALTASLKTVDGLFAVYNKKKNLVEIIRKR